jgi:hypothetical protein
VAGPRTYSEEEAARILERAASLQQGDGAVAGDPRRMSLAELEEAGAEAGIDRALVRRAAVAVDSPVLPARSESNLLAVEATLAADLDETDYERLVAAANRHLGEVGNVGRMGQILTWHTDLNAMQIHARDGVVTIRLTEKTTKLVGDTIGPVVGIGGVAGSVAAGLGAASVFGPWALPVAIPLWLVAMGYLGWRLYRRALDRRRAVLERALAQITGAVEDPGA